jgi:outer membrane protein assembly factor BamA
MRSPFAQVVILATAGLLAGGDQMHAQAPVPGVNAESSCPPSSASNDKRPFDPETSVAGVTFSGFLRMPVSAQDEIAASITEQTSGAASPDEVTEVTEVTEEALEVAKRGWQDHGYFKVQANGYAKTLASTSAGRRIALSIHVDEGLQYRLGGITFKNNILINSVEALRGLFPIEDGEVFNRGKIATGLDNLSKAFGEMGYIRFTSVPETRFDDEKNLIYLDVDMDEGKQFYVAGISVLGLDDTTRAKVLQDFLLQPGQIYNSRLVQLSLRKQGSTLPGCSCPDRPALALDEKAGLVTLTFDFRPCPGGN